MPLRKRIYAVVLLAVFSMVAMHDLLPHAHHAHGDSDGHAQHHEDHHREEQASLLEQVGHVLHLHEHEHSDCEIEICPELPAIKQSRDSDPAYSAAASNQSTGVPSDKATSRSKIHTADYSPYSTEYLSSLSSRGPPAGDC